MYKFQSDNIRHLYRVEIGESGDWRVLTILSLPNLAFPQELLEEYAAYGDFDATLLAIRYMGRSLIVEEEK